MAAGESFGQYLIVERIGAGGMGEVYRARDQRLGRDVAIKILRRDVERNDERLRRFTNEARAASALNHPNILTIYDIGDADGVPFIAMEFVDGVSLRERLRSGAMSREEARGIAVQVAAALVAAHATGLVHRDLKPENVMVRRDGYVKVVDFGLAALSASSPSGGVSAFETVPAGIAGTPAYMAPEQINGGIVDRPADIFAFGVLLCELLTGSNPFARPTALETLNAIARAPEPAVALTSGLPPPLRALIVSAVDPDPRRRPPSMETVRAALEQARESIQANPPARAARGRVVAAILATAAVAGLAAWLARRAPADRAAAPVQLTHFSTTVRDPAVSPDGKLLVYVVQDPDSPNSQLYAQTLPDGQPRQLTRSADLKAWPSFSTDGSRIAYTVTSAEWKWDTWVVPATGGTPQLLLRNAAALQWLPDGRVLFSEFKRGAQLGVSVADENRGGEFDLYVPPGTSMAHFSDVSPDGQQIAIGQMGAFVGGDSIATPLNCFVASFRETETMRRPVGTAETPCSMYVRWTQDGKWLYFSSGRGSRFDIVRQRPDGGPVEAITRGDALSVLGVLSSFALTRDGASIIYPSGETHEAILVRGDDGKSSQLTVNGDARNPIPFSDGKRLLYISGPRFLPGEIWVRAIDGTSSQRLFSAYEAETAAPSPDGVHVAFTTTDSSGGAHLMVGAIDNSSAVRELGPGSRAGGAEQISTLFSPAGDTIFYTQRVRGGVVTIWRVDLTGANARPIADAEPGLQLRSVSADGKWISVIRNGRTPREAWMFPADGGPGRRLLNGWGFAWMPGNRGFLLTAGGMVSSAWVLPNPADALVPAGLGESPTENTIAAAGGRNVMTDYFFIEPIPMPPPFTIVYSKVVNHSNLYRLALRP